MSAEAVAIIGAAVGLLVAVLVPATESWRLRRSPPPRGHATAGLASASERHPGAGTQHAAGTRTYRRTAMMLAVAAGAALIGCASTEHARAEAQAPMLARAADHFNQAASDADRAAAYLDRAARTMLTINGVDPAHVQGFSEFELALRDVAHVLRDVAETLSRARLPLTRGQVRKVHEIVRAARGYLSDLLRAIGVTRQSLPELRGAGQELSADDAAAVAEAVGYIESALDSVDSMVTHADAAGTELERLAAAAL